MQLHLGTDIPPLTPAPQFPSRLSSPHIPSLSSVLPVRDTKHSGNHSSACSNSTPSRSYPTCASPLTEPCPHPLRLLAHQLPRTTYPSITTTTTTTTTSSSNPSAFSTCPSNCASRFIRCTSDRLIGLSRARSWRRRGFMAGCMSLRQGFMARVSRFRGRRGGFGGGKLGRLRLGRRGLVLVCIFICLMGREEENEEGRGGEGVAVGVALG